MLNFLIYKPKVINNYKLDFVTNILRLLITVVSLTCTAYLCATTLNTILPTRHFVGRYHHIYY